MIMDIINNFDREIEGKIWKEAFETIYNDIPSLLAKLVLNKDNRESMIKIMKVKPLGERRKMNSTTLTRRRNLVTMWRSTFVKN